MTRDEAREFAKVVQAYADDKVVQVYTSSGWRDIHEDPCFDGGFESYRIKPESREFWITLDCDNDVRATHKTLDGAARAQRGRDVDEPYGPFTIVHVREVMP